MKKWVLMAMSLVLVSACGNEEDTLETEEETTQLEESTPEEDENDEAGEDVSEEEPDLTTDDDTTDEDTDDEGETSEENNEEEETGALPVEREFDLVVPAAEEALSENQTVLASLIMVSDQYAPLVKEYEQPWLMIWAGIVTMDPDTGALEAYYLLVNDTGDNLRDIEFSIGLMNNNTGEIMYEDIDVMLSHEEYGVWEDQTVMPFSVSVPEELEDEMVTFMNQGYQGVPIIENMDYEIE